MPDYRTNPLRISASATGGADVDVSATLLVDDLTDQDGDATLVDVHLTEKEAELRALRPGKTRLQLIYVVVPLVGNGEFKVKLTVSHPNIVKGPRVITKSGNTDGKLKVLRSNFILP